MKLGLKRFAIAVIVALLIFAMTGCNKQIFDTVYSYDYAVILMPDGSVVRGKVELWTDYSDGDQLQIQIDGKTYLVHSMNVVLIKNQNYDYERN